MKIRFLLIGTSLSFIPSLTFAQCVATQDCATLGYTETSCPDGTGIKCPFGNWWACITSDSECEQQFCDKYGFKYTCTGTNETGGSEVCNNKYAFCSCADGYYWENGSCQQKTQNYLDCKVGALFYSDNTCSNNLESSKTLLGVVIMDKTSTASGWIMTINPVATGIAWGGQGKDIPGLTNITSTSSLNDIQSSCTNTDIITAYGNSSTYPAAWAAKNYKPSGTPSSKSWCLPSGGLLNYTLNNQKKLNKINAGISTAGGKKIGFGCPSYSSEIVWSSSEKDSYTAFCSGIDTDGWYFINSYNKFTNDNFNSVRPVMEF